jgi:hypothetical protein
LQVINQPPDGGIASLAACRDPVKGVDVDVATSRNLAQIQELEDFSDLI